MEHGQERLLRDILHDAGKVPDARVRDICRGGHHIMVLSHHAGLSARMYDPDQGRQKDGAADDLSGFRGSALELASGLLRPEGQSRDSVSCALAAMNSILPVPGDARRCKGQELIDRYGRGKNVVIVGHFPFVEKMGQGFRRVWVLERYPRPGDLDAEAAGNVLPRADVVALTATTLLNGTAAGLLGLVPAHALTIMLGPSTPFAPCLFDWGIDALSGCSVKDPAGLKLSIQRGGGYHSLQGTEPFTWVRGQRTL